MDFSFTSDQQDLRELAAKILNDATTLERVKRVLADADGFDRDLWSALAEAGILGISLPESVGGAGLGFLETCIVLEEVGRTAAPIPALAVMGLAAPALVEFGATDALAGVADGTRIVTAALTEAVGDATTPSTSAAGGKLTGEKVCVPAGLLRRADRRVGERRDLRRRPVVAGGHRRARRHDARRTDGAPRAARRGGDQARRSRGAHVAPATRAQTATAVTMSGAAATALDLTSTYVKERKQFGRAIGTFQAVSQRAADTYINKEAIKLTSWQAAWRLDTGKPAATQVGDGQVLGGAGRARRAARRAPSPRWGGRRPRLPAVPLLPARQADGARPRLRDAHADAPGRAHRRDAGRLTRRRRAPAAGVGRVPVRRARHVGRLVVVELPAGSGSVGPCRASGCRGRAADRRSGVARARDPAATTAPTSRCRRGRRRVRDRRCRVRHRTAPCVGQRGTARRYDWRRHRRGAEPPSGPMSRWW